MYTLHTNLYVYLIKELRVIWQQQKKNKGNIKKIQSTKCQKPIKHIINTITVSGLNSPKNLLTLDHKQNPIICLLEEIHIKQSDSKRPAHPTNIFVGYLLYTNIILGDIKVTR